MFMTTVSGVNLVTEIGDKVIFSNPASSEEARPVASGVPSDYPFYTNKKVYPRDFVLPNGSCLRIGLPFQKGKLGTWTYTFLTPFCLKYLDDEDKTKHPKIDCWSSRSRLVVVPVDIDNEESVKAEFPGGFSELQAYLKNTYDNAVHSITHSGKPKMFLVFDFGSKAVSLRIEDVYKALSDYLEPRIFQLMDQRWAALRVVFLNPTMVNDLKLGLPLLTPIATPYGLRTPSYSEPFNGYCIKQKPSPARSSVVNEVPRLSISEILGLDIVEDNSSSSNKEVNNIVKSKHRKVDIYNVHNLTNYAGELPHWAYETFRIKDPDKEMFLRCLINIPQLETGWGLSKEMLGTKCHRHRATVSRWIKEFKPFGLVCVKNTYRFGGGGWGGRSSNRCKKYKITGDLLWLRRQINENRVPPEEESLNIHSLFPGSIPDGQWNDTLFKCATNLCRWLKRHQLSQAAIRGVFLTLVQTIPNFDKKPERLKQASNAINRAIAYRRRPRSTSNYLQ